MHFNLEFIGHENKPQSSSSASATATLSSSARYVPQSITPTPSSTSASTFRSHRMATNNLLSSCQIYSTTNSVLIANASSNNSKTPTSVSASNSSTTKVKRSSSLRNVTSPICQQYQSQPQPQQAGSTVKRSSSQKQKSKVIVEEQLPIPSQQLSELNELSSSNPNSQELTMFLSMAPLSSANLSHQNQQQLIDISSVMLNVAQYANEDECSCYLCQAYKNDKRNSLVHNYEIIPNDYKGNHRYMKFSYGKPYSQLSCMKLFNLINTDCTIYYDETVISSSSSASSSSSLSNDQQQHQQYLSADQQTSPQQNVTSMITSDKYFCHVHNNRPPIYDSRYIYIIDCRLDRKKYEHSHINTSIHFSDLLNEDIYLSPSLENYTIIVLYDDDGTYLTSTDVPIQSQTSQQRRTPHTNFRRSLERQESSDLLITRIKEKLNCYNGVTYLLSGGYDQFHSTYPFMCSANDIRSTVDRYKHLIIYPNCVLENQIFIGTGIQAKNWKIIRDLNITHIVNCSIEHECIFSDALKYLHCRLEDSLEENIYRDLEKACRFIDNALSNDTDDNDSDSENNSNESKSRHGSANSSQPARILIHCNLGISRSSSILIAYLIRKYKLCLYSAFNYVKDKRTQTAPNYSFLKQLKYFEDKNVH